MSFKKEMKVNKVTDASIQIHFDYNLDNEDEKINLIRIFQNNSFLQKSNLNITPISNFINGYFSLAINGKTMQKDTIVSYSYDDNFNKVEEKKVQEKEAPKMYLNLGTQKEGFQNYLQTKGAIEHGIFTAFPYYNFHVSSTANTTLFATSKTQPETTTVKISNFLDCKIDFNKLKNDVSFPKSDLIFSLLNNFNLSANVLDQNKIALQGALTVNNNDVNIITQLFFGLENSK